MEEGVGKREEGSGEGKREEGNGMEGERKARVKRREREEGRENGRVGKE